MERRRYVPPSCGSAAAQAIGGAAPVSTSEHASSLKRPRMFVQTDHSVIRYRVEDGTAATHKMDNATSSGTGGVAQHIEEPPQSFVLQLTRAATDAAWGFLVYKASYPVRVGRVDTTTLRARRIAADGQETNAVTSDVTPLLQKNDIIVRIDDVVPESHDAAMRRFFRPKCTMRLVVQRPSRRSASSKSSCTSTVVPNAQTSEMTLHDNLAARSVEMQGMQAAAAPAFAARGRLGLPAPPSLAHAAHAQYDTMSATTTQRQADTTDRADRTTALPPTSFSPRAGGDKLLPWLDKNAEDAVGSEEDEARRKSVAAAVEGTSRITGAGASMPAMTLLPERLLQHNTRRDAMRRTVELTRDELLHGCSVLLPPSAPPHATQPAHSPTAVHGGHDTREGGALAWLPPMLSGGGSSVNVDAVQRREEEVAAERRRQTSAARVLARDARVTLMTLRDAAATSRGGVERQPALAETTAHEGPPGGMLAAMARLPAPRRQAVHDRTHCPFGPESGFGAAFHDGVQAFMTSLALFRTRQSLVHGDALATTADAGAHGCSTDVARQTHETGTYEPVACGGAGAAAMSWEMGGLDFVSRARQHLSHLRRSHSRTSGNRATAPSGARTQDKTGDDTAQRQPRTGSVDSSTAPHDGPAERSPRLAAMHKFMNAVMADSQARRLCTEKAQQARLQTCERDAQRWRETYAGLAQLSAQHVQGVRRHEQELLRRLVRRSTNVAMTKTPPEVRAEGTRAVTVSPVVAENHVADEDTAQRGPVLGSWDESASQLARRPRRRCHRRPQGAQGDDALLSDLPLPSGLQNRSRLLVYEMGAEGDVEGDKVVGPRSARLGLPSPPPPPTSSSLMQPADLSAK